MNTTISYNHRQKIESYLKNNYSYRSIGKLLHLNHSTIYYEVKRNGGKASYDALKADEAIFCNRIASKENKPRPITGNQAILDEVEKYLMKGLSPLAITGRVKLEQNRHLISHQSIYNHKPEWKKYLPHRKYRKRRNYKKYCKTKYKQDKKPISKRPIICLAAIYRSELGHYEMDTVHLREQGCILTLLDRKTRYLNTFLLLDRKSDSVKQALIQFFSSRTYRTKVQSITTDNGKEFSCFKELEDRFNIPFYFCAAYASWQKGSNENANRILRRYFPKSTTYKQVTNNSLQQATTMINLLPRKILGYLSAYEAFNLKSVQFLF